MCSSPISVPEIKYGHLLGMISVDAKWNWLDVSSPITKGPEKVCSREFEGLHDQTSSDLFDSSKYTVN